MIRSLLLAATFIAAPAAASPFGDAVALGDAELGAMRGGIQLPGGIMATIGVAIETRVDGRLAVRTQISSEAPGVSVFAGGPASAPDALTVRAGGGAPDIRIERNNAGTVVTVTPTAPATTIRIGAMPAPAGTPLALTPGGPGVATALGTVTLNQVNGGFVTELSGPTIAVRQLLGQAVGTIIANNADNRVIDTVTNIDVALTGQVLPGDIGASIGALFQAVR